MARPEEFICCHGSGEIVRKVKHSSVRIENPLSALYMGTEYFSLARTFRTVWGGEKNYIDILDFFDNRSTNASAESFNAKIKNFRAQLRGISDVKYFLFRLQKIYA